MVDYFKFTLAIFNFNCLTLKLIEKIGFLYFSNNSSPTFINPKIMKVNLTELVKLSLDTIMALIEVSPSVVLYKTLYMMTG